MNLTNLSKSEPIEPDIELDGGYAYCVRCLTEIVPTVNECPKCHQKQDWSWLGKYKNNN